MSFQWVFMPFVLLLLAITARSAINIYDSIQGRGLEEQGLPS
jgi:hypothetical protein